MTDGALDLVVLVLCLAILTPIGIKVIIPLSKEVAIQNTENIGDKTVLDVEGVMVLGDYDGSLDIYEVVLTTQVQDFSMPNPRLLTIPNKNCPSEKYHYYTRDEVQGLRVNDRTIPANAGCLISKNSLYSAGKIFRCEDTLVVDIDSMYKPDVMAYGTLIYAGLSKDYVHERYKINYNYGRHGIQRDKNNLTYNVMAKESYRVQKVK